MNTNAVLDITTALTYQSQITFTFNIVVDTLDSTYRYILRNNQNNRFANSYFAIGIDDNNKLFGGTGGNRDSFPRSTNALSTGVGYEVKLVLSSIPATATFGGTAELFLDGVSQNSSTGRGELFADGFPPRYLGDYPGQNTCFLGKVLSGSIVSAGYTYTWSSETSNRTNTGSMPVLDETTASNHFVGTAGFSTDGSDWVQFGSDPAVVIDQATLSPGGTISGTYSNFTPGVAPTSPLTLTDSNSNTLSVAVTVNDNASGGGTFSGTLPALPSAGNSGNFLLFGNVTATLDDA